MYGYAAHACACAWVLEWCVVGGVHNREQILTEGGAVCPLELSHKLENKEQKMIQKCDFFLLF